MRTHVAECSAEEVEQVATPSNVTEGVEAVSRRAAETDADKVRLQRLIRRKTTLARRALAAHRKR